MVLKLVIAAILVLAVIKCCDKGKVAPYYTVRPGTRYYLHNDNQLYSSAIRTQ